MTSGSLKDRAQKLLTQWDDIKAIQHSHQTKFIDAIDIEIEKALVEEAAQQVNIELFGDSNNQLMLAWKILLLHDRLKVFEEHMMIEILRHGQDS